jgi:4-azaleucine resistance transporter AzlC
MDQVSKTDRRRSDFRAGCRDIAPAAVAAVPIALLFGAVAAGKGLSPLEVTLMSILVFGGGAQFAAIEIWAHPAPVVAVVFTALLINARHILMGASLGPKLHATRSQKLLGFWFLTDEAWAVAEHRSLHRSVTAAYWFGMAAVLPIAWIGSTALGAVVGPFLGDPRRLGADFAFTALFIGLIAGFGTGKVTLITTAVSAAVAALVHTFVGAPWHVASGALAGIAAAYLASPPEDRP